MTHSTTAQLLNLGGGPAIEPGEATGALAQADALEAGVREADKGSRALSLALAKDRLAAALLRDANRRGASGSTRALIARTLMNDAADTSPATPAAQRVAAFLVAGLAEDLPADDETLWLRLQDAFAPITRTLPAQPAAGWFEAGGLHMAEAADDGAASTDPLAALPAAVRELLAQAENHAGYSPAATRLQTRLANAMLAIDTPSWLGPAVGARIRDEFDATAETIAERISGQTLEVPSANGAAPGTTGGTPDPINQLERLSAMARLYAPLTDVSPVPARRAAQAAFIDLMTRSEGNPGEAIAPLAAAHRLTSLLDESTERRDESRVLRQLRPGYRLILLDLRASADRVAGGIADALRAERPLTDPAVLALLAERTAALTRLRDFEDMSRILSEDPDASTPRVADQYERLADRMLIVARGLDGSSFETETTRATLGRFAAELRRFEPLTQNAAAEFAAPIEAAFTRWREGWAAGVDGVELDANASALDAWLAVTDAEAALATLSEGVLHAQSWPGFEMSPAALERVVDTAQDAVRRTLTRLARPGASFDADLTRSILRASAPARLIALIQNRCADAGVRPGQPAVLQIGLGSAADGFAWGYSVRADVALFCHLGEELLSRDEPGWDDAQSTAAMDAIRAIEASGRAW